MKTGARASSTTSEAHGDSKRQKLLLQLHDHDSSRMTCSDAQRALIADALVRKCLLATTTPSLQMKVLDKDGNVCGHVDEEVLREMSEPLHTISVAKKEAGQEQSIQLTQCDAQTTRAFIEFLYRGCVQGGSGCMDARELLDVALTFEVKFLGEWLATSMHSSNLAAALQFVWGRGNKSVQQILTDAYARFIVACYQRGQKPEEGQLLLLSPEMVRSIIESIVNTIVPPGSPRLTSAAYNFLVEWSKNKKKKEAGVYDEEELRKLASATCSEFKFLHMLDDDIEQHAIFPVGMPKEITVLLRINQGEACVEMQGFSPLHPVVHVLHRYLKENPGINAFLDYSSLRLDALFHEARTLHSIKDGDGKYVVYVTAKRL